MSDKFDQEAEALLPHDMLHRSRCPCRYRFAVAARLRADSQKLNETELRFLDLSYEFQSVKTQLTQAQAEIERLTRQVTDLQDHRNRSWADSDGKVPQAEKIIAALRSQLAEARKDAHDLLRVMALHPLTAERCNVVSAVEARLAANREKWTDADSRASVEKELKE